MTAQRIITASIILAFLGFGGGLYFAHHQPEPLPPENPFLTSSVCPSYELLNATNGTCRACCYNETESLTQCLDDLPCGLVEENTE